MTELERGELDALAARWRRAFVDDSFERCCTPDVSYEDPLVLAPLEGLAALRAHAAALRRALPDARVEATAPPLGGSHHACLPWRLVGTHRGEVSVLPASGRRLTLYGVHYVELVDGAVRRARGFFDLYEAAVQLGLLPARGGLGETALLLLRGFGVRRRSPI